MNLVSYIRPTQLVQNGDFSNGTTGWTVYSGTGSVSDNILSVIGAVGRKGVRISVRTPILPAKYLYSFESKQTVRIQVNTLVNTTSGSSPLVNQSDTFINTSGILDVQVSNAINFDIFPSTTDEVGNIYLKNIMLINLTELYGVGNEPSTVAQFKADFPSDYYEYRTSTTKNLLVKNGNLFATNN